MGLMILFDREDALVLWLLLLATLGLTFYETRELELDRRMTIWWMLLVALTHVVGYLGLRMWGYWRRRSEET